MRTALPRQGGAQCLNRPSQNADCRQGAPLPAKLERFRKNAGSGPGPGFEARSSPVFVNAWPPFLVDLLIPLFLCSPPSRLSLSPPWRSRSKTDVNEHQKSPQKSPQNATFPSQAQVLIASWGARTKFSRASFPSVVHKDGVEIRSWWELVDQIQAVTDGFVNRCKVEDRGVRRPNFL